MELTKITSLGILICLVMPLPIRGQESSVPLEALKEAAGNGDAEAQFQLGRTYDFGFRIKNDNSEAVKWYKKAAAQKHSNAQFYLGTMYYNGEGVAQDYILAHLWFNVSAATSKGEERDRAVLMRNFTANKMTNEQITEAWCDFGSMYEKGKGVDRDLTEAMKWWRKAAGQDFAMAQYNLGMAYAFDPNDTKDYIIAHMWLEIASSKGYAAAIEARSYLAHEMTSDDIEEAEKRARVCMQSNYKQCD